MLTLVIYPFCADQSSSPKTGEKRGSLSAALQHREVGRLALRGCILIVAAADLPAEGAEAPVTLSSLPSRIPPQLLPGRGLGCAALTGARTQQRQTPPPPRQPRGDGRASPDPLSARPLPPAAGCAGKGAVGLDRRRRRQGRAPEGAAARVRARGSAGLLPPCRAAAKSRGGGGAAAAAGGGRGAAAAARGSAAGALPPLKRREITRSLRGGRGGSGRPSSPRACRRMSRSAPRSAPAAGTSLPSAPGGGGAEASSSSTMAGSACRLFAPRISAALGGGRERRRSAPGPARTPAARPPCRARGTPARRSRTPGPGSPRSAAEGPRSGDSTGRHPLAPQPARLHGGCV